MRRVLSWSLAVAILLAAAVWGGLTLHERATFGTKINEEDLTVEVDEGDRFSLAVPDRGASVGDSWTATVAPAGKLEPVAERKVPDSWWSRLVGRDGDMAGGGGGTTYFVYEAKESGTAVVTVANCFQGCDEPSPLSRTVIWQVSVR
ncbi:hypothetical protein AB0C29_06910 [Actinoplanes sp. NPDC048791]|uniref:hypothetical protein n=1 Tax=Actinoplanes sp. NPDC048791 TaxID=3154623 RepID=UPI0033ED114E